MLVCRLLDVPWARTRNTVQYFTISRAEVDIRPVGDWSDAATNCSKLVRSCSIVRPGLLTQSTRLSNLEDDSIFMPLHSSSCVGLSVLLLTVLILILEWRCLTLSWRQQVRYNWVFFAMLVCFQRNCFEHSLELTAIAFQWVFFRDNIGCKRVCAVELLSRMLVRNRLYLISGLLKIHDVHDSLSDDVIQRICCEQIIDDFAVGRRFPFLTWLAQTEQTGKGVEDGSSNHFHRSGITTSPRLYQSC